MHTSFSFRRSKKEKVWYGASSGLLLRYAKVIWSGQLHQMLFYKSGFVVLPTPR